MVEPTQLKNMRTSNRIISPGWDEIIKICELPPTNKPVQRLLSSQTAPTAPTHRFLSSVDPVPCSLQGVEPPRSLATTVLPFLASRRSSEAPGRKIAGLKHLRKILQLLFSIQAIVVYVYIYICVCLARNN